MKVPMVIIGAGPAGSEAAVQLRRGGADFLLLEKERVGGLLNEANRVENFPGVPGGVPGRVLAARLARQLLEAGIAVQKARVLALASVAGRFLIRTAEEEIDAEKVILACGTQPLPPAPPLDRDDLRGLVFTSVRPLLKARQESVAIIGGGDAALDYALTLAAHNRVHVLVRAARPRALPLLVERCRRQAGITIHENCRLADALPAEKGEIVLRIVDARDGRRGEIRCQRILSAIGRVQALDFLDANLRAALAGPKGVENLHLAGDAGKGPWRYAAMAAADGQRAAMEALA